MRYDLSNDLKRRNFSLAVRRAWERRDMVEFHVMKHRSLDQNSYLHVCLAYLAKEYGESLEYVKTVLYKQEWNADIFRKTVHDNRLGKDVTIWRSSADLTVEEMKNSIDNMRNHASRDMGIYIPSADEKALVEEMEKETWR